MISKRKLTDFSEIQHQIWRSILQLYGEAGAAAAGVWILPEKYNAQKQRGILKASHTTLPQMKAALAFVTHVGNDQVVVRSRGVSGMLSKAQTIMLS